MCFGLLADLAFAIEQFWQSLECDLLPFFQLGRTLRAPDTQFCGQLADGLFFFHQLFDRICFEAGTVVFAHGSLGLYFCLFDCPNPWVHYSFSWLA